MFEPHVIPHGIDPLQFFVTTPMAQDWYEPLKPYTLLEYEWVKKNIHIYREHVIDAGCHHGNYSVLFSGARKLICLDAQASNCDVTRVNLKLNHMPAAVICCAVAPYDGEILFNGESNGRVGAGNPVPCKKLKSINPLATIVKLDVEGSEFGILPAAIDEMGLVNTWIVEIHPTDGDPHALTMEFVNRGWDVLKVDRNIMAVVPYAQATPWTSHATIIARRK